MSSPVEFGGVSRFYEPGKDISVNINRASNWTNASPEDWVGIFPVGWQSPKEFIVFLFVRQLDVIVFGSSSLNWSMPDSFYQFVYVSAERRVLATSDPFQFQIPYDDISLLPDEEDSEEMVMLMTRARDGLPRPGSQLHNTAHFSCPPVDCDNRSGSEQLSGFYFEGESRVILEKERDKYRRQLCLEKRISERQEEKYAELEMKYCAALADKEKIEKEHEVLSAENARIKKKVEILQRDHAELDKEMKRLAGLVDELSKQDQQQSQEIVIVRPPPYLPPSAYISGDYSRSLSSLRSGEQSEAAAAAGLSEDEHFHFQCPVCDRMFPKSIGSTAYQRHVNLHFY